MSAGLSGMVQLQRFASRWFWLAVALGVVARGLVATRGYNYDIESYRIVADILAAGGNVYRGTERYNYGPVWFNILGLLDALPAAHADPTLALRWKVSGLLTLVDLAIALVLRRNFGALAAVLFMLNPVSIIITGYHGQFDNLAILFGLLGVLSLQRDAARQGRGWWLGLGFVGLSLATKHILFMFPVWLAIGEPSWRRKLLALLLPYAIFALGFLPYLREGRSGIVEHVLLYRSFNNAPLWLGTLPASLVSLVPPIMLFFGSLFVAGWAWRERGAIERYVLYLVALVVFSSALANQYLAICMVAIAVSPSWPYAAFTAVAAAFLSVADSGLHVYALQPWLGTNGANSPIGYQRLMLLLAVGLAWQEMSQASRRRVIDGAAGVGRRLAERVREQLRAPW
jgi:hypothetical protein